MYGLRADLISVWRAVELCVGWCVINEFFRILDFGAMLIRDELGACGHCASQLLLYETKGGESRIAFFVRFGPGARGPLGLALLLRYHDSCPEVASELSRSFEGSVSLVCIGISGLRSPLPTRFGFSRVIATIAPLLLCGCDCYP